MRAYCWRLAVRSRGTSREVVRLSTRNLWNLLASPYVVEEVLRNLGKLPVSATAAWPGIRNRLRICDDVLTIEKAAVFPVVKDRPVLFTALAWADVLLTLDRGDFSTLIGQEFYGLPVLKPGAFLERERRLGRLEE